MTFSIGEWGLARELLRFANHIYLSRVFFFITLVVIVVVIVVVVVVVATIIGSTHYGKNHECSTNCVDLLFHPHSSMRLPNTGHS